MALVPSSAAPIFILTSSGCVGITGTPGFCLATPPTWLFSSPKPNRRLGILVTLFCVQRSVLAPSPTSTGFALWIGMYSNEVTSDSVRLATCDLNTYHELRVVIIVENFLGGCQTPPHRSSCNINGSTLQISVLNYRTSSLSQLPALHVQYLRLPRTRTRTRTIRNLQISFTHRTLITCLSSVKSTSVQFVRAARSQLFIFNLFSESS
ncbi:hypothetical protein C8R43DRAFT_1243796 [Mycena crocata]|nr:hypothetical protein C8R43DRAFT_1243796 [Mycena crocata]